ncbi:MAG: tRNA uridine-5-carboxymethylaminomethyl(34) synthesis enzyme MnmG [Candidatus Omnitrophica bacterium]|nr:tRNA uridine-5-carboxymethylaminomethyl(34) synthesis enzyme MnmG [Candidatus Omnitrophota bacterium]
MTMEKSYDVIVVGAGHAGIEASLAASRMGCSTLMFVLKKDSIAQLSCNPAIGGVGKGQLVKEIDALGGEMAKAADASGIHFRLLNASKGAAVHSSRAQVDRMLYKDYMIKILSNQSSLTIKEATVSSLLVEGNSVRGVFLEDGETIYSKTVILCPGTFLNGLIHVGLKHYSGGRIGEPASISLEQNLKQLGLKLLRFKTGTCARLDRNSIDFSQLTAQPSDNPPQPFSFSTKEITNKLVSCYITYTNENTHQIIRNNLDKSPLYTGIIKATGVRYCPSIEDKVVKFSDKVRHQIFLEPEGLSTERIYPNGLSTSLPEEVQLQMIHSVKGLEQARVIEFGYGIEHSVVDPTQLFPTLETKLIRNLFLAGQINGTTGYEEAAAQGLIAGINAALKVQSRAPFILDRATAYIGVLIDDLVTKGTNEPYRMFTSRVEYRLLLRENNADIRLRKLGYELGLISQQQLKETQQKKLVLKETINKLRHTMISASEELNQRLISYGTSPIRNKTSLEQLLKRPQIDWRLISQLPNVHLTIPENIARELEIEVKYEGFVKRQLKEVERFRNIEKIRLSPDLDYRKVCGLSKEIQEKLMQVKPLTLGQASRISGVTPAAISILMIYLRKLEPQKNTE